jgi:lipoyl-dependent peroxiredoxin
VPFALERLERGNEHLKAPRNAGRARVVAEGWYALRRWPDIVYTDVWLFETEEASMIRKAKAIWRGAGRDGTGHLSTDSGVLASTPYSFRTRFENEKGTNPEELIAAAHAGCFTMALAFGLQGAGLTPTELSTEAVVSLEPEGKGFRINRSALTLRAKVPNLDATKFAELAREAEKNCPVSKVLNAEITLDAKLI